MIAHQLFGMWGTPTVDLITTRLNRKVKAFYSRLPDPLTLPGDPLVVEGTVLHVPTTGVSPSSTSQDEEEAQVIAIIPLWPR